MRENDCDWGGMHAEPLSDERLEWLEEIARMNGLSWQDAAALFSEIERLQAELLVMDEVLEMVKYGDVIDMMRKCGKEPQ